MNGSLDRETLLEWIRAYQADPTLVEDEPIRAQVEAALLDPEVKALVEASIAFDEIVRQKVAQSPVPSGLLTRILVSNAPASDLNVAHPPSAVSPAFRWLHWGAFGAAAAAILALTLTFTFSPPGQHSPQVAQAQTSLAPLQSAAFLDSLVEAIGTGTLQPVEAQSIRQFSEAQAFLTSHGRLPPKSPPKGLASADTFSCRLIESQGLELNMICFDTEDGVVHLFTFAARDLPETELIAPPGRGPVLRSVGDHSVASWMEGDDVHMLVSRMGLSKLATRL